MMMMIRKHDELRDVYDALHYIPWEGGVREGGTMDNSAKCYG
jgi:hypothetical protein